MIALLVLAPIVMGILMMIFRYKFMKPVLYIFQILLAGLAFYLFLVVKESGPILFNFGGLPDGVALSFYGDTISIFIVLMTALLFVVFLFYTTNEDYAEPRFYFLFLVLQGLMMGLFLSSDLFNIFIFLEVSTVVVSILIMYNKDKQAIYDGMIYFFVNVIGTAFLLFGTGMLYRTFGLLDIRALSASMSLLESPRAIILPLSLILVTISLKTAVTPLFSWLPKAHGTPSAPPVVSATLSGLYIKSGVYLFVRITEMFSSVITLNNFFFWIGFLTALIGFIMALSQNDIKLLLAYSTVSQVGFIMMGINIGSEIAFWGSIYHMFSHAIFKSTLFLTAGLIIKEYGTRNIHEIKGLFQRMPVVAFATFLSILGVTGAPFFNGSISKYLIAHGARDNLAAFLLNVVSLGTIMYYVKYASMLGGESGEKRKRTPDKFATCTTLILGIIALFTGIFGAELTNYFFGFEVQVNRLEYIEKSITYTLMLIGSVILYKRWLKKDEFLTKIGHLELTFNGIVTSMAGYLILLILVIHFIL